MTVWKAIPGYEELYEVSDLGQVRSLDREHTCKSGYSRKIKGKVLKPRKATQNRLYVDLHKNKNIKRQYIHTLVALAFIGKRPNGYDVCHNNGDNQDNRLTNLRYDTKGQNQIDIYRQGGKHGLGKLNLNQVLEIRQLYSTGNYTLSELAEMFNVSEITTRRVVRRISFSWLNDDGTIDESLTKIM